MSMWSAKCECEDCRGKTLVETDEDKMRRGIAPGAKCSRCGQAIQKQEIAAWNARQAIEGMCYPCIAERDQFYRVMDGWR